MGALAPVIKWCPADDLLLKNAVEAGASLESLSEGTVRFSQRYTVEELKDRWHSLLYDPIVSIETSARMFEYERSSLKTQENSGNSNDTKDTKSLLRKRKSESIRARYYAMRRKMTSNVSLAGDPLERNFLAGRGLIKYVKRNKPPFTDYILSDSFHRKFPDSTFEVTTHACPEVFSGALLATSNGVNSAPSIFVSDGLSLDQGDLGHNTLLPLEGHIMPTRDHCMTENYGQLNELPVPDLLKSEGLEAKQPNVLNRDTESGLPVTGCMTSFHNLGSPSSLSPATAWHAMEGTSTPILLDIDYGGKKDNKNDTFRSSHDGVINPDTFGSSVMRPNANLYKQMPSSHETEIAGIIDQLNKFMDCTDPDDPHNTVDEFCIDTFSNLLVDYLNEHEGEIACPSVTSIATEGHPGEKKNSNPRSIEWGIVHIPEENAKLVSSALSLNSDFPELRSEAICCKLNTEDNVIPDNDDVFLPVCMPTLSLSSLADWEFDKACNPVSLSIMDIPTHQKVSRGLLMKKREQSDHENPCLSSHRVSSSVPTHQKVRNEGALTMKRAFKNHDKTTHGGATMTEREQIDRNRPQVMSSSVQLPPNISHREVLLIKREETDKNQTHITSSSLQPVGSSNHAVSSHDGILKLKHIDPGSDMLRNMKENDQINQLKCTNEDENDSGGLYILEKAIYVNKTEHQNHNVGCCSIVDFRPHDKNLAVLHNGVVTPRLEKNVELSDSEECPDDDDIPCFSDVEAMILDMDLTPNDEDSDLSETESRHPNEELIRTMLRLEQAARASSHRMMQAYGAFAVLYSHHSRYLIKKPEVLLGRTADDDQVDIDLSTERCRNKVSRRQAIIKVNDDGAFFLKNLGKASIYVNGREVAPRQVQYLTSSCLIEIRNVAFLFETNPARVKRHLEEKCRGSKVPKQEPAALERVLKASESA